MKKFTALVLAASLSTSLMAKTEIVVEYAYSWFTELHEKIKTEFEKENPDITIKFLSPNKNYEENTAKLLREKMVDKLPDVAYNSFNYLETLKGKNVPVQLDAFLSKEDRTTGGYTDKMLAPTMIDGKTYGIAFAASLPIAYYNMSLVKEAGWNKELPKTWDEIFELSQMINKLDGKSGVFFANYTDVWLQMALVMSQGGNFIKDGKVGFNNEIGEFAFKLMSDFHTKAKSPAMKDADAKKSFMAGNLGIYLASSAGLVTLEKAVGNNFEMKTSKFPGVKEGGKLPVGGSIVMLTSDKNKEAAMKYIKFVTGKGNQYVPQFTGYMATNQTVAKDLVDFYAKNPNYTVAPSQLDLMGTWPSFPGENALKCSNIINSYSEKLLFGDRTDYKSVLSEMSSEVNKLLP